MKTKLFLLLSIALIAITTQALSQQARVIVRPIYSQFYKNTINRDNPPGTIKIKQYYIDKTEIANIHWLEFLFHKKKELDSLAYQSLLPDSSNIWYMIPSYRFAPVVRITYEQAIEYCKWRSEVVSRNLNRKVTYRLPTKDEWREIAEEQMKNDAEENAKELSKTLKYLRIFPNDLFYNSIQKRRLNRVYHLFNNVSEMTMEKNIAVGANNKQLVSIAANLETTFAYDAPSEYIGFRCIAEVE